MTVIATIATGKQAAAELKRLIRTIELFESGATLYVDTDSETAPLIPTSKQLTILKRETLNAYSGKTRAEMEAMPGRIYSSLFKDYTMQKTNVLEWALTESKQGIWFLDADIALFAPLPKYEAPKTLALSPHYIRPADEAKFGHFNSGIVWLSDARHLVTWRRAIYGSRFYEQAALEDVWKACPEAERVELPPQVNLGWWRYDQSVEPPPVIEAKLGFCRQPGCMGLKYDGFPLQSVHTHWDTPSLFNQWIKAALQKIQKTHAPARQFLQLLP